MKRTCHSLLFAVALFAYQSANAVVGYYNFIFYSGDNLFHNNLSATDNHLSSILQSPFMLDGTTVSLWNPVSNSYDVSSTYSGGTWSTDLELLPGTGAKLTTSSLFTNTFVGEVVSRDGVSFPLDFALPPVFDGPDGRYLLGDKIPVFSTGTDVWQNVIGRMPNPGEAVTTLDGWTQTFTTCTWDGSVWDISPSLNVGQAAFFDVGAVPEPSVGALGVIGLLAARFMRRR